MTYIPSKYQAGIQLYNANETSMRKFRKALAKGIVGGTNAHVMMYGDSITGGTGATTFARHYPVVAQSLLASRLGLTLGTGFLAPEQWRNDSRFAITGTLHHDNADAGSGGNGPGPVGTNGWLGSGESVVFTPGRTDIDRFTVYFFKSPFSYNGTGGTVQIDSGSLTNINCFQATFGYFSQTFDVSTGSAHTVTLAGAAGATNPALCILGIEGRVAGGVGGLRVGHAGYSSMKIQQLQQSTNPASSLYTAFDMLTPDLSVIMLETNDYNQKTSISTFTSQWQTAITKAKTYGDVLMVTTITPNFTPTSMVNPLSDFTAAMYALADSNNVALLDIAARWKDYSTSSDLYTDQYHPTDAGHRDIGVAVANAIAACGGI